ncbi:succinyl-diaminopimelate desuccinylase [Paracoccus sp. 1_MG-2023]|uniref:succinyl-diaminopimelate desuccinylase n=1 Tax=unclassified Paracoccus (in: a-proteobacteria) TaxID=2688777 RepID=UPI001C08C3DA|nr:MULTISPECIES: succinyl-diaminopimelate desuccinylase [unclassified Paracoccus (in: a-proteobacteria)]MBU2956987.1 succinyl-diaminopimelate desuccinylase [Paracoccus sp. C2R09]MDO6668184.1 succinyl-diaminopimelate desuccinylase [Paracoccus sp. 1_MG-2023]
MTDPADLTARLIRCPSVTPAAHEALELLEGMLADAGFECHRTDRNGTPNLFARWGAKGAKTIGFNGHVDVVPTGDPASWTHPPFSGHLDEDGIIWGRGATDMKSGVAAFVAAAIDFVRDTPPDGAIILTITGDEEGPSKDGTPALLDWMDANGERMDACIVGEPSNPEVMGEMMKIGRRGSMTFRIRAKGKQGHAAYPHKANNPLHALTRFLFELTSEPLDNGTDHFDPSGLQVTSIDCGNPASNVIPELASAVVNIRFNDLHTGASLTERLQAHADRITQQTGVRIDLQADISGEAFLTAPGPFVDMIREVVTQETNRQPVMSTTGGTSDARYVKNHCPVVEFGLVGQFMHQVDERVPAAQVHQLKTIYQRMLERFFA